MKPRVLKKLFKFLLIVSISWTVGFCFTYGAVQAIRIADIGTQDVDERSV